MPMTQVCNFLMGPRIAVALAAGLALGAGAATAASPREGGYHAVYRFKGGTDGGALTSGLVADSLGNLYGTTLMGGQGNGVVFQIAPDGTETVIYAFTGGGDGGIPTGPVVIDNAGNFYGVTLQGGSENSGVIFKVTSYGALTVLHDFQGGRDGASPAGGLIISKSGYLYGTTRAGGPSNAGTVFRIELNSQHYKVLHAFTGGVDGTFPFSGVIEDSAGNLYGTTQEGGPNNNGVVFKVARDGTETVLYSFTGGTDGGAPNGLIADTAGNLYGTTVIGGTSPTPGGTVFKLTPDGTETVLYSFTYGSDGGAPAGALFRDTHGNFYGTTTYGGTGTPDGNGVVFKLAKDGTETVLHAFAGGKDGGRPFSNLIQYPAFGPSDLYGTTYARDGSVFRLRR